MRLLLWQGYTMTQLRFREKLFPPLWAWAAIIGISIMLSVSMSAVFGNLFALITFILLMILFAFLALRFSPVIEVDDTYLYVGRAKLPLKIITNAAALSASETTKIRGINSDPKCFSATSPLINTAIRIDFLDAQDPHTYWLVSSRKPVELSKVLQTKG